MNIYDKILISQEWLLQFETIVKMKSRDELELQEYEKKPDHNPKAVAIRREKLQADKNFINITKKLIDAQAHELKELQNKASLSKYYKDKYDILEKYSRSKGIDTELTNYMRKSDFINF